MNKSFSKNRFDVFISHANEDKTYARDLANALTQASIKVWIDAEQLEWGDDLRAALERGLSNCSFGIVIFSKAFLSKKRWTEHELNALFAREQGGEKVVLPLWHEVTHADMLQYSSAFADRVAMDSSVDKYPDIVNRLQQLLQAVNLQGDERQSIYRKPHKPAVPEPTGSSDSPLGSQRHLPVSLQLHPHIPGSLFAISIKPQFYNITATVLDISDEEFLRKIEVSTQYQGRNRMHEPLDLQTVSDGVVFSSAAKTHPRPDNTGSEPVQQIYVGSDGEIVVRFHQNSNNLKYQTLSVFMIAYRFAQGVFDHFRIFPSAHARFIANLNSDRLNEHPVLPGQYEHSFFINLREHTYTQAYVDPLLRFIRGGGVSVSRQDILSMLQRFSDHDRSAGLPTI